MNYSTTTYTALTKVFVPHKYNVSFSGNLSTQQLVKIQTPIVFSKLLKFDMLLALTLVQFYESFYESLQKMRHCTLWGTNIFIHAVYLLVVEYVYSRASN